MIIGLGGFARAGKDTVGDILVNEHGFKRLAFADAVREYALILNPYILIENLRLGALVERIGWDQAKKVPEVRRTLQVVGTELFRAKVGPDYWVGVIDRQILLNEEQPHFVLTDVRYHNELRLIQKYYGISLWVDRPGVGPVNAHSSDNTLSPEDFDGTLENDGTIAELKACIDVFLQAAGVKP